MNNAFRLNKKIYDTHVYDKGLIPLCNHDLSSLKLKWCVSLLSAKKGRVLEVGSGSGSFLLSLMSHNPALQGYGCDISFLSLVYAKKNSSIAFTQAEASKLPYRSNSFDVILLIDILEHVEHPEQVLHEIKRILKEDGVIHCFSPCEGTFASVYWLFSLLGLPDYKKKYVGHIQKFKVSTIASSFADFSIIDKKYSYHFFGQIRDIFLYLDREPWFPCKNTKLYHFLMTKLLALAYKESSFLKHVPFFASAIHLTLKKK